MRSERHMKPLLGLAIQEAVHLAIIDCCDPDRTPEQQMEWEYDIYAIPSEQLAQMDPIALAQNVACRLMGPGGWRIGDMYTGNATPRRPPDAGPSRFPRQASGP